MKNVCVKMMMCLLIVVICSGQGFAKEPLQPVTIQLNWVTNVQFAGILVAKERGWYEDAGIDLTIKGWKIGISSIDEVVAGRAQIGVAEGDTLIKAGVNGNALRAIATQFQETPFCLMSKKSLGIETPEQLKGRTVGINSPESVVMTKIVLASKRLEYKDIVPVQVGWEIAPLIDDKIDVYAAFMNNDPLYMKEKGYEINIIPAFRYGYDFYSGVCFVTETMIRNQPDLIQKFLDVTLRGWKESFKDLAVTAKLIVEKYYPEGSVSQQTESLKVFRFLARLGKGRKYLGWMEEEYWAKGIDILHDFKQTDRKIPATDVFTLKFLEDLYFGKKK